MNLAEDDGLPISKHIQVHKLNTIAPEEFDINENLNERWYERH